MTRVLQPIAISLLVLLAGCQGSPDSFRDQYGCYTGDPPGYSPSHEGVPASEAALVYRLFRAGQFRITDTRDIGSVCPLASLRLVSVSPTSSGLELSFSDGCGCYSEGNLARVADFKGARELQIYRFSGVDEYYPVPARP